jgi:hypothetical protein
MACGERSVKWPAGLNCENAVAAEKGLRGKGTGATLRGVLVLATSQNGNDDAGGAGLSQRTRRFATGATRGQNVVHE